MASLERQHFGIRTVPLTYRMATTLEAGSDVALNGDGTCSKGNMSTSCFASETCSLKASQMKLSSLASQPLAFVTIDDRGDGKSFVGCVSAAPASRASWVGYNGFEPDALVLSNLCVANDYRGQGVGRTLVERILSERKPTYLLIAKAEDHDADLKGVFQDRVERLQNTYSALGFDTVDIREQYILLKHMEHYQKTAQCKCLIKHVFFFDDSKEFLEMPIDSDGLGVSTNEHGGFTVGVHVTPSPSELPLASVKRKFPKAIAKRVGSPNDHIAFAAPLVELFDRKMRKHDMALKAMPNNLVSWMQHFRPYFKSEEVLFVFDFDWTLQTRAGFVTRASSLKQYTLIFTEDKHDPHIELDLVTAMFGGWARFQAIVKMLRFIKHKIVVSANPCKELIRDICKKHLGFEHDSEILCDVQDKRRAIDDYVYYHNAQPSTFLDSKLAQVPPRESFLSRFLPP